VTPEDVKQERELTFNRMFKDSDDQIREKIKEARDKGETEMVQKLEAQLNVDKEALLDQYLSQQYVQSHQYVSRPEFDLLLETNACLRKIAEASKELKNALTDETLQKAFAARYGEKIVVRHIQGNNPGDLQVARNRINAGENFADVAKAVSTNKHTGPLGGALPPFTMNATNVPQVFKEAAFALKDGEVSDIVQADNAYHLIKVESRIAPRLVKFEDVKENLRAELYDQVLQAAVKQLRDKLSQQVLANLKIEHPTLREQFQKRLDEGKAHQKSEIDDAMKRSRPDSVPADAAAAAPDAAPAPGPTSAPAKTPTSAPAKTTTPPLPAKPRPASTVPSLPPARPELNK
jgi:parvulin-like peptidyl-prolyl isomerase